MADLRVLIVGLGHMGLAHGRAYDKIDGYEIVGLCARSAKSRTDLPEAWGHLPRFSDYYEALLPRLRGTTSACLANRRLPEGHSSPDHVGSTSSPKSVRPR